MKAATLTSPQEVRKRPLQIVQVATPEPKPSQVLVRVHVCGVCRTDLLIVEGDLPPCRPGIVPGHQIVGEVVTVAIPPQNAAQTVVWSARISAWQRARDWNQRA